METTTVRAEDFLGRSKRGGQDFAEAKSLVFRLIRIDANKFFDYPPPEDQRTDRVCVEIDAGKITKVVFQ